MDSSNLSTKVDTIAAVQLSRIGSRVKSQQQQNQSASNGTLALIQFKVGDAVWCKLKGHPEWPAKIKDISGKNNQYVTIIWFNDYRSSKVHKGQLKPFKHVPAFEPKNIKQATAIKEALFYISSSSK